MDRFVVKFDGYGSPAVYDTEERKFVGNALPSRADAAIVATKLNARGGAPVHDTALPDQLTLDGLAVDEHASEPFPQNEDGEEL